MENNEAGHEYEKFRSNLRKVVALLVVAVVLIAIAVGHLIADRLANPDTHRMASATPNRGVAVPVWWDTIGTDGTTAVCSHCEQGDGEWFCTDCSMVEVPFGGK